MCGINGILKLPASGGRVDEALIVRMRETMAHRGPDGAGTWMAADGRIGLGHRRLAIVDLSTAAAQPMTNDDASMVIVFNGEIYNHAEIRRELQDLGVASWKTDHSDTEVILRAFERWGIDCLPKLRGMFAFALWDARRRDLWLVRDRLGIKPLYYSVHHGQIAFASEIKALLADPQQQRAVNEEALFHYLSFVTVPAPLTMFAGIHKLAAGSWLRVPSNGDIATHKYWDVLDHTQPLRTESEASLATRLLDELRASVHLRKMSDVPVGVFLSGGIDSSTNAALFSEGETRPIQTFTIGYEGDYGSYTNETEYARTMARAVGADHHELLLTQDDLLSFLPEMVRLQDEPIADPVCVPVYYVAKLAREHGVVVCQVGEGSDELFWGYEGFKKVLRFEPVRALLPGWLGRVGLLAGTRLGKNETSSFEWLRRAATGTPLFWGGHEGFTETAKHRLLSPRLRRTFAGRTSWEALEPLRQRFRRNAWEPSPLHWMTYLELNLRLPELLLMRVDKMTMGVGVEARVPFLDHKLVEMAMSMPSAVKTRHGELKHILKRAVRGLIPDELINRRKQGFGVPIQEWFFDRLGDTARREVEHFCQHSDLLDWDCAQRLLAANRQGQGWYLLNLALWWREYIERPACPIAPSLDTPSLDT